MKFPVISQILTIPIGLLMVLLVQKPSLAWLKIRNQTPKPIYVAIGYRMNQAIDCCGMSRDSDSVCKKYCPPWVSEGWWRIEPGQVRTVLNRNLRYSSAYYFHAHSSDRSLNWGGNYSFCVTRRGFKTMQRDRPDCADTENFRELRTGGAENYTFTLNQR